LCGHLPHFGRQLAARLIHLCDARAICDELFVEFAKLAFQIGERGSLFGKLIVEAPQLGVDGGKDFEIGNLIPKAQT